MRLLITAFEPFGGEEMNASLETMAALPEKEGVEMIRIEVPVTFRDCAQSVLDAVRSLSPDALIMLGQAGGRKAVTPERFAHNLDDARIPDNSGDQPRGRKILSEGDDRVSSTLPVDRIVQAMRKKDVPAEASQDAGAFVCNHLMYEVLCALKKENRKIPAGFIHLPYLTQQNAPDSPSITLETAAAAVGAAVDILYEDWRNTMKTLICYPKCTTCQKAVKWLEEHQIAFAYRNIKEQNPTAEELRGWMLKSGLPARRFFNTSGLLYRSMGLKEKLGSMTQEEMLALLATDGMLVKRPLLITESAVLVGFRESEYQRVLTDGEKKDV